MIDAFLCICIKFGWIFLLRYNSILDCAVLLEAVNNGFDIFFKVFFCKNDEISNDILFVCGKIHSLKYYGRVYLRPLGVVVIFWLCEK